MQEFLIKEMDFEQLKKTFPDVKLAGRVRHGQVYEGQQIMDVQILDGVGRFRALLSVLGIQPVDPSKLSFKLQPVVAPIGLSQTTVSVEVANNIGDAQPGGCKPRM
ncbi:TPA: hypothetical protein RQN23_004507 [Aeromonas veronii]|nr:hypothetical protein [Aeromonas veronii]